MTGRVLGREPVVAVSTAVALLIAVLPVFGWSTETVGLVAAALVALGGGIEAALVSVDRLLPLLVGIGKAVVAAAVGLGLDVPDSWVSAGMAVLTVLAGLKVRDQVGAVQPPRDRDGRELDGRGFPVGVLDATEPDTESRFREEWESARREADGPETGGAHAHTEVFGAVAADGPVPERGDQHGAEQRERQAPRRGRHWQRGDLGPQFGA